MDKQQLEAIRARDADDYAAADVLRNIRSAGNTDPELEATINMVADRRALLSAYDALAAENAALRKDAERYRDDAREYHRVMGWLRATKMQHGLCQPRERRACTHCNAVDNLEDAITAYRGPPIILAAAMEGDRG